MYINYKHSTLVGYVHHQLPVSLDAVLIGGQLGPGCLAVQEVVVLPSIVQFNFHLISHLPRLVQNHYKIRKVVWFGLENGITHECDQYEEVNSHFPVC